jgi:ribosomal protein S3
MDEFSLLNGINIQIATTRNNLIIGKNSSSVSI